MMTIKITGPKEAVKAAAKQFATLMQHQHKVVATYDINMVPEGRPVPNVDVLILTQEEVPSE